MAANVGAGLALTQKTRQFECNFSSGKIEPLFTIHDRKSYCKSTAFAFFAHNFYVSVMFFYYLRYITQSQSIPFYIMLVTMGYPKELLKNFAAVHRANANAIICNS